MIVKPVGIENVVNWQDDGVFADTQKPVTDDNYTLAGDVNQDNLYVGYMKEHGLKGKLSLPVLSSLGAITGRQTIGDCEVYKHVNGTTIIKGAVINPNLPDSRISLGFSADENGLQYYNNPNDPMPIKTINMNGLQKWEETDDYIIYVDKDAMMTTVQQYVTGTYDLFLERKADVDGALELLRENGIEWTAEDDSKLLQDINLVQLEKIASTPTTMDEPTEIQTFEARTVPTTYECCFRTDKKTGEIYIGEGYENLTLIASGSGMKVSMNNDVIIGEKAGAPTAYPYIRLFKVIPILGETYSCNYKILEYDNDIFSDVTFFGNKILGYEEHSTSGHVTEQELVDYAVRLRCKGTTADSNTIKLKFQITKTSTPKPFVKSVMPSGKLSFVTNATSKTHSFVGKDFVKEDESDYAGFYQLGKNTSQVERVYSVNATSRSYCYSYCVSSLYFGCKNENDSKYYGASLSSSNLTEGFIDIGRRNYVSSSSQSFKQLLIYKGNLTESELKAENEKEINIGAYYHQENSVPLTYGIDSMKSMRVYSPTLTDAEIAEEVNKNIYIPENRDGVPNYLGEVK